MQERESMHTMNQKTPDWLAAEARRSALLLNDKQIPILRKFNQEALPLFLAQGLPSSVMEEWRLTNLEPHFRTPLRLLSPRKEIEMSSSKISTLSLSGRPKLVFVDGSLAPAAAGGGALPQGVEVYSAASKGGKGAGEMDTLLSKHLGRYVSNAEQPLAALNSSFLSDCAVVHIRSGLVIEEPIEIVFIASAELEEAFVFPRVIIVAEENCQCTVVETYLGETPERYCTNAVTEIVVASHALVNHVQVNLENKQAIHLSSTKAAVCSGGKFSSHLYTIGGNLTRNDLAVELRGEGARGELYGLSLMSGEQHADNHTAIDHIEPHCSSEEIYKGVYAGRSEGVFSGTIIVRPGAQKTSAFQANKSLLLSREASVNAKPHLTIWADDVKCTHGATVGQIDQDALFYLRSRGIDRDAAFRMLLQAFAAELITHLDDAELRKSVEEHLEIRLAELPLEISKIN